MSQITFDTLEFVKTLEKAGFSTAQAEAITHAQKKALGELAASKDLATRQDILELKQEMLELENRLDNKLAAIKIDLVKWVIGGFFMQTALLVAILAWLFPR